MDEFPLWLKLVIYLVAGSAVVYGLYSLARLFLAR
jgi:hypothetical protein